MKLSSRLLSAVLVSISAFGQRPEFEVASIKPSPPTAPAQVSIGVHIDGARVSYSSLALKDYIRLAYRVKLYQAQGPDWIASERYEIAATLPAGANRDQVPDMLQTLLADRFQLKMHHETKEFPVYALVVGKGGLKMKESAIDSDSPDAAKAPVNVTASGSAAGTTVNYGAGSSFTFANNRFEGKKLSMADLADTLGRFVDRPVIDMTELKGNYDSSIEFSPEDFRAMQIRLAISAGVVLPPQVLQMLDGASGDSLPTALQTLGLRMEPRKAPLDVLVIDHAEKTPTAN
jgi:uncharacterized protein (TIGR03435 family)